MHKNKLKMVMKHKHKTRYYKLLEENIGRMLFDIINCSNIFSEPSPRAVEIKTKINK